MQAIIFIIVSILLLLHLKDEPIIEKVKDWY